FIESEGDAIAIAVLNALFDAAAVDVNADEAGAIHGRGQRLGAPHATHPTGNDQFVPQRSAEVLLRRGGERFVGALNDTLAADVDPRTGGHLSVHGEAQALQAMELFE